MKARKISFCILFGILLSILVSILTVVIIFINSPFNQLRIQDDMLFRYREEAGGYVLLRYMGDDTEVTVPDTVSGKPVVAVGAGAFQSSITLLV